MSVEEQDERRVATARRMAVFRDAERMNLLKQITETPDHVCSCCHRKFYWFGGTKPRAGSRVVPFALELLQPYSPDLIAQILWLCTNCRGKLDEEDIPALSISNDLTLAPIPEAIQQLNHIERRLIAPVHTFQRIIALQSGRQQAAKGIAISFPYNVGEMVQTLPCPADDFGIITVVCNVDQAQPVNKVPPNAPPVSAPPSTSGPNASHSGPDLARPSLSDNPNEEVSPPNPTAPASTVPRFYSVHWTSIMNALRILRANNVLYRSVILRQPVEMNLQSEEQPVGVPEDVQMEKDLQHSVALNTDPQVRCSHWDLMPYEIVQSGFDVGV
jgi:hypothetical protein